MPQIIEIRSFDASELDVYARLSENQLLNRANPEEGLFIAESPKVIERALNAGCVPVSALIEKKHIEGEGKAILERLGDIPVFTAEFEVLAQLTGFKLTRGMLCAMRRPMLKDFRDLCKDCKRIAVLYDVVNPTNVGAIFRSAAAMYIDAVLLTSASSNPLYRRASRVSMGTVFQIPWTYLPEDGLHVLQALGYKTVAMALKEDTLDIEDKRLKEENRLAIILGTEGDGLPDSVIDSCDYTVKIPMSNGVDSLNVAAASAVAFWELSRDGSSAMRSAQCAEIK